MGKASKSKTAYIEQEELPLEVRSNGIFGDCTIGEGLEMLAKLVEGKEQ